MSIAFVSTFPNYSWEIYSRQFLQSFVQNMPQNVPLMVQLDDDLLFDQVNKILRQQDGIAVGWNKDHADFVARNKDKDDPHNYRKQPTRFCHKVFAIHRAYQAALKQKESGGEAFRYLIWIDADVHITRPVTHDDIKAALPKEGDTVAYLGRKDWPHSECGWMAFDLKNDGGRIIELLHDYYIDDHVITLQEHHDSWVFDKILEGFALGQQVDWPDHKPKATNLTEGKPGTEIWEHSPMASWSKHYKGPKAKQELAGQRSMNQNNQQKLIIQTKNSIPHEEIRAHIEENQRLIKNWVNECAPTEEEIIVVSAGPMLVAEELRKERGKKIVAVKHAITPLKNAGIKPWACILLDPRPHVADFVKEPDNDVIWFVASQVNPLVTTRLIAAGCTVWGYHAAVGADEQELTKKQLGAIISGGSATATRGLFLLHHLGFRRITLYGYDLSFSDKPDLKVLDDRGQPKYLEATIDIKLPMYHLKKCFWSEPQLLAQYEEFNQILNSGQFEFRAYGDGIVPLLVRAQQVSNLRVSEIKSKIIRHDSYKSLLWNNTKKTRFLTTPLRKLQQTLRRMRPSINLSRV